MALFLHAAAPSPQWAQKGIDVSGGQKALFAEYGFVDAVQADLGAYQITGYRFKDATGSLAGALWLNGLQNGNYTLTCSGACPEPVKILNLSANLPKLRHGPEATLPSYMPEKGLIPQSARYILGTNSLHEFAPGLPLDQFGPQFSPEAETARYQDGSGEQTLILLSYPTPSIARQQVSAMEKAHTGLVKRAGPLVALIPSPLNQAAATALLQQIQYQASVQWNEPLPIVVRPQSVGQMVLAIFSLAGIVLVFCLFSGLLFGGYKVLRRRFGNANADESMIVLGLHDR